MKIHLQTATGLTLIRSYAPGRITVNEVVHLRSLIVLPDAVIADWPPRLVADITAERLAELIAYKPEVVLIGTGAKLHFPPPAALRPLLAAGIGVEAMDTQAACRTFNILADEGRRVLGALLVETPACGAAHLHT